MGISPSQPIWMTQGRAKMIEIHYFTYCREQCLNDETSNVLLNWSTGTLSTHFVQNMIIFTQNDTK